MKRGDLVLYKGSHWIVQVYDPRRLRIAQLLKADGEATEVPFDQEVEVVGNPAAEWPFVTVPEKPLWGKVTTVSLVRMTGLIPITLFSDYLFSDPLRSGGSLFLRPGLGLRVGDILQVAYEKADRRTNVPIVPSFGTVAARQARAASAKLVQRPTTAIERLLDDDRDFDE